MRKIATIIVTLIACVLLTYLLWSPEIVEHEHEEEAHHSYSDLVHLNKEQAISHGIMTEAVSSGKLQKVLRAPAKIAIPTDKKAHILPKVSGIALLAKKNLGETVLANELIATLESKDMAEAKAAYLNALKKEELSANGYTREKNLFENKLASTQEFNEAEHELATAKIERQLAYQKLLSLGLSVDELTALNNGDLENLRLYDIRSPISGNVIARHITPGELVGSDQEIYVIADLSNVWAEISVFSQDRPYVKQGQPVTIVSSEGKTAQANMIYLSPIIDENTRTSKAIALIDNSSGDWLPGMFAQVEIISDQYPVSLMIPKEAIQSVENEDVVFVPIPEGFSIRPITIGRSDETCCEVLSGLQNGEQVATKNTFLLKAELLKSEAEHMD